MVLTIVTKFFWVVCFYGLSGSELVCVVMLTKDKVKNINVREVYRALYQLIRELL